MAVLIAPDSFKGTFTAAEVAAAIASGVDHAGGTAIERPLADGGEGTLDALCAALRLEKVHAPAVDPWGARIEACFGLSPDGTAVVEVAAASGLTLASKERLDPLTADTAGTGMLISAAVRMGANHVLIAAGGSATTDGGLGAIEAIRAGGGLRGARLSVLADVLTPFEDAATVFAPQKGANPRDVARLTKRLHRIADELPRDPRGVPRSGAAGGFAGGLWACFDAELVPGAETILDTVGFNAALASADAVIVGEGRLDSQTSQGKLIHEVLTRTERMPSPVPVFAVVGSVEPGLGRYAERFADILVAGDIRAMHSAGARVAHRLTVDRPRPR